MAPQLLVLAPYVPHPPSHGGSIRSRVQLEALCAEGSVHLAVPIHDEAERTHAATLAQQLGLTVHELPGASGGPHGRTSMGRKLSHWSRGRSELLARRWHPDAVRRTAELLRLPRDLVVADSSFVLPLLPPSSPPLLLFLHNLESAIFGRRDQMPRGMRERLTRRFESGGMAREERRAMKRAALTVMVSEVDAGLARSLAGDIEVGVVPNSVDVEQLTLQAPKEDGPRRLLFVGGLDYPPNLEAVTELVEQHLPSLRAAYPGLVVRLVGRDEGDHGARFADSEGVERVGPVDDLLPHYRASDAAYLPIRSGGGTRIKILEAFALGLPVLATAVAAEGLDAEDGVHLRHFETVEQGVRALGEVLAGQGAGLRDAARALVERSYSHPAAIEELRVFIRAALERGGPAR